MTIDEAIKDIKDNIKPVVGGKSLDMAIEALEKQRWIPCGKCIHADGKHRWCKILDRSINEDYFCCWAEPYREEGD